LAGFLLLSSRNALAQFDQVARQLGLGGASSLSDSKVASGLKEALQVGAENALKSTAKVDGYFGNEAIKILRPKNLQPLQKGLGALGYESKIDAFVLSMNRAAEAAASSAKEIFADTIVAMSFEAAKKNSLRQRHRRHRIFQEQDLGPVGHRLPPLRRKTMSENSVSQQYEALAGELKSIPFIKNDELDINKYVLGKALDGLFYMLGEEEKKIRKNPAARTTELLKEVFAKAR